MCPFLTTFILYSLSYYNQREKPINICILKDWILMKLIDILNESSPDELHDRMVQKRIVVQGIPVSVEIINGGTKHGQTQDGQPWQRDMKCDYGYIEHIVGDDGDFLDCYVGDPDCKNDAIYVVHQLTPDGSKFDEDKVMLGFNSAVEAKEMFLKHCHKPNKMYGGMCIFDAGTFMEFLQTLHKTHPENVIIASPQMQNHFVDVGLIEPNYQTPLTLEESVPFFDLKPEDIDDYLEAMFTLPYLTRHKMSQKAKKIFDKNIKGKKNA